MLKINFPGGKNQFPRW